MSTELQWIWVGIIIFAFAWPMFLMWMGELYMKRKRKRKETMSGCRWRYKDARGVECEGTFVKSTDFGGTDITYWFRRDDGALDLVSGSSLKEATRIWK